MLDVRPFNASYIQDAAELFAHTHAEARQRLPLIPPRADLLAFTTEKLAAIAAHPGYAAFDGKRLVGYMVELFTSPNFMGRPTGFSIGLFPCASTTANRAKIYQLLYKAISRTWIERGFHAHQLSFFATDDVLTNTFFRLGFGMTHFQLFRDLNLPPGAIPAVEIRYMDSAASIREIEQEHAAYYPNPPLFWIPHDFFEERGSGADGAQKDPVLAGEIEIIAAIVDGKIAAYFELSKGTAENDLFSHPGNGQIKGAYSRPAYRGRGIGKALLAEAVRWAKRNHLERLYVEGESANIYGGTFWATHFHPAEYSIRRCIDERITPALFTEP